METRELPLRRTIRGRLLRSILPLAVLVTVAGLTLSYLQARQSETRRSLTEARSAVRSEAAALEREMAANDQLGRLVALAMESNTTRDRGEVTGLLRELLGRHPRLLSAYVAFEPGAFDGRDATYAGTPGHDATGRFLPAWTRRTGPPALEPLADVDTADFYLLARRELRPVVLEPYLARGVLMTSFVAPILEDGAFRGVAGVDVALDSLHDRVGRVRLFDTGHALLVSPSGVLLAGGDKGAVGRLKLADLAAPAERRRVAELVRRTARGEEGELRLARLGATREAVLVGTPVRATGWSLVAVVPEAEVLAPVAALTLRQALLGVVAVGLLVALVVWVARQISRPLVALDRAARRAAAGDLTAAVEVRTDDEVGSLARSFDTMLREVRTRQEQMAAQHRRLQEEISDLLVHVAAAAAGDLTVRARVTEGDLGNVADAFNLLTGNFADLLAGLQAASGDMAAAASGIAEASRQLERGASRQGEELAATGEALAVMAASLREMAAGATQAVETARRAEGLAGEGGAAVGQVTSGMAALRQNVQAGARRIKSLGERTLEISAVTATIREIAAQTHILALNAGLEAGRAGEMGRGFAVVAEEVRRLNDRVGGAVRDIERLVGAIQQEAQEAVVVIESQTAEVERQSQVVVSAGAALERIGGGVRQSCSLVLEIEAAARRQTSSAERVTESMDAVLEVARGARREVAQTQRATETLATLASGLASRVAEYRVLAEEAA